jgi:hypothetical protein
MADYFINLHQEGDPMLGKFNIKIDPTALTDGQVFIYNASANKLISGDLSGVAQMSSKIRVGTLTANVAGTDYVFADHDQDDMADGNYVVLPADINVIIPIEEQSATKFKAYAGEDGVECRFFLISLT